MKSRVPISIRYLLTVYVIGMVFFSVFRLIFVFSSLSAIKDIPFSVLLHALFMGLRFDTVVSGYILIVPAVILIIAELAGFLRRRLLHIISILVGVLYSIAFALCATDIPFFKNFGNRLNLTIFNWIHSPMFVVKMVFAEWSFVAFLLLFIAVAVVYVYVLVKVRKKYSQQIRLGKVDSQFVLRLLLSLVFVGLVILGIRGRVEEKTGIKVGSAYFSNYDFANQMGLNPVFTFGLSVLDASKEENKRIHFVDEEEAIRFCRKELHIVTPACNYGVSRNVIGDATNRKPNVVIVLMESMSSSYLARFGNTNNLTPHLDSLANRGISFDNFYSAGIHTFNGIYSSLYAMPAIMAKHTMFDATIPKMSGLPYVMKENGYKTIYFTTHDDQFDNVGGFLTANYMDTIISKRDYPASKILSTLGVPDHFMFDYSLPIFDHFEKQQKPFFAVMMTASNHGPYTIPKDIPFVPKHTDVRGGCVEYADWAIGHFMESAKTKSWYNNTIFVFVADHGSYDGVSYGGMPLALNHIPCIIYSVVPKDTNKVITSPGGQIDLFPTLAGLLGFNYTNNTMGIDLLHDHRPYIYFSQDDKIGVADTSMLYTWYKEGEENLYSLKERQSILEANKSKAVDMQHYVFSMLQCTQWMLEKKQTGLENIPCK